MDLWNLRLHMYSSGTYICDSSVLLAPLFVRDAGWEGVSNFTVIRGIGGAENGDVCDGSA